MTHKDIYRHLLADLVSYLEYHLIKIIIVIIIIILWNIKEGILKTVGNKAVLVTNDFHCMNKKY